MKRSGADAEALAVGYLQSRGYLIIARNVRFAIGELDIVASIDNTLVIVEVRSRTNDERGGAEFAISKGKRAQVSRVAAAYVATLAQVPAAVRFDVIAITGDTVEHLEDAWRLGF